MAQKRIVAFHLYNDFSGSPKVLRILLEGLAKRGYKIHLFTSKGGILDDLSKFGVNIHHFYYKFSSFKPLTALLSLKVQLQLLYYGLIFGRKEDLFFINTILPFGAALAGKIRGCKVIYHYHENAFVKSRYYAFLGHRMERFADKIICVSQFQANGLSRKDYSIIPNPISNGFKLSLNPDIEKAFSYKRILMLSSLKGYKGTKEFIQLASMLPDYNFEIVINDTQSNIDDYCKTLDIAIPANLTINSRQSNVAQFYSNASIVLNLSDKKICLETFGLTVTEAFAAGLPVIVPTEGGISELVQDGVNGYKIDVVDLSGIAAKIHEILSNHDLYIKLAKGAKESSLLFDEDIFINNIEQQIN